MIMQWFKMYAEFAYDPKVQSMPEHMQRRLVMLFCLRCGDVTVTLDVTELAFALRVTEAELEETKALFMRKGFIDSEWNVLNWEKRQQPSDTSAARTRLWREKKKSQTQNGETGCDGCDVTVTSQKRHCDALDKNRIEKKETPLPPSGDVSSEEPVEQVLAECIPVASPAIADSATTVDAPAKPSESEPDTFAEFWATYPHHPHRRSRKSALAAYRARLKAGRTPDELMAAARKMADDVRAKGDDRQYIPAAERWLSSGKWEGWLASVAQPPVAQPSVDQMAPDVRKRYEALLQAGVAAEMATA